MILRRANMRGTIKGLIFLLGVVVVIGILSYARYLVVKLREEASQNLQIRVHQYSLLATYSPEEVLDFTRTIDFPLIYADSEGQPKFWKNLPADLDERNAENQAHIRQIMARMDAVHEPIPFQYDTLTDYFHYGDSDVIRQVQIFPVIVLLATIAFGLLGYFGYRQIRRSEESGIWVGMARETAHQLGTPISSIMGWIEVLESDPGMVEALEQMKLDAGRLEKIAYRFSKIGSEVDLAPADLETVIQRVVGYFSQRIPRAGRDVHFQIEIDPHLPQVMLNEFLFEWVIENLVKNSLDSMASTGGVILICARSPKSDRIHIDLTDTGKGIDPSLKEDIFRPGFTTKKRGWGLGLSLARRIVQQYHGGRIFVLETRPGAGITFRIILRYLARKEKQ